MFSTDLTFTLEAAYREATNRKHHFFCLEHLLYAMLFQSEVAEIIEATGGDIEILKGDLDRFFLEQLERSGTQSSGTEPVQTPAVQRVLQRAIMHMHSAGKEYVSCKEVLVALYSEPDSHAVFFLKRQGVSRLAVIEYISHGVRSSNDEDTSNEASDHELADSDDETPRTKREKALVQFAEDLTARAAAGELDPVIGRDAEIERSLKILSRRQKNNPSTLR